MIIDYKYVLAKWKIEDVLKTELQSIGFDFCCKNHRLYINKYSKGFIWKVDTEIIIQT